MNGEISVEELDQLLAEDADVRVVDIRSAGAFDRGHIPGSENIPMSDLAGEIARLEGQERVVTVCPHGKASVQAARLVDSYEGFDGRVESLAGGVDEWVAGDRPWEGDGSDEAEPSGSPGDDETAESDASGEADAPF